jgi:hypothetical protein
MVEKMESKYLTKSVLYMIAVTMSATSLALSVAGYGLGEHFIRIPIILLSIGLFVLVLARIISSE